jgi:hypothetical protein
LRCDADAGQAGIEATQQGSASKKRLVKRNRIAGRTTCERYNRLLSAPLEGGFIAKLVNQDVLRWVAAAQLSLELEAATKEGAIDKLLPA